MTAWYDYLDVSAEGHRRFPAHGWIEGTTGVKSLRLPVMRLYQLGEPTHQYFVKYGLSGVWLQTHGPCRTLRQLSVCLRDLHAEVRFALPILNEGDNANDGARTRLHEGFDRLAVLLLAAFTLLRRLADELIDASRPFLFTHWQSAPRHMKKAIPAARDKTLLRLRPICDLDVLQDALSNQTAWFTQLREDDGLRDILIHQPHALQVTPLGTSPDRTNWVWRLNAHVIRLPKEGAGSLRTVDLFPALLDCVAGACRFMEGVVRAVRADGDYDRGDVLFLTGMTNDIAGCWPPIVGARASFPLID